MPLAVALLTIIIAGIPSAVRAQSATWTPEVSIGGGLVHVFRWEDRTYGDRTNAGGGVAIAHSSGWAFEIHADRTFGLTPPEAPCGLVNVICVGVGHDGPTSTAVASINARYHFGKHRVQPYLIAGLGVLWSRSMESLTQVEGPIAIVTESQSRDRGFGPELGGGLRLPIGHRWSVNGELRWLDAPWLSRQNLAITRLVTHVTYAVHKRSRDGLPKRRSRMVPEEGVEPTHSCLYGILSPARLPVPPLRPETPIITTSPRRPAVPRAR